jgi:hypothetical protein
MHPSRAVRRASRLSLIVGLILAVTTVMAPTATAANQLAINATLPAAFKISGKITNSAGTAVAGVQVSATGGDFAFATTNAAGDYVLQGLEPGSYNVQISPPSTSNYMRGYYTTANANHFSGSTPTAVVVGPNKMLLTIKLVGGYTISGTVANSGGTALAGASVSAFGPGFAFASTSATGAFVLRGLPAGSYDVSVGAPSGTNYLGGYYTTLNSSHVTPNFANASDVVVGPNKTLLQMRLLSGFSISGKVTNAAGTALGGVLVVSTSATASRSAFTNASGIYSIKALATGSYKVGVQPGTSQNYRSGFYTTGNTNYFTTASASATNVAVGPSKTLLPMKLPAAFTISGKVTNTAGVAIANASIYADGSLDGSFATSDAAGNYVLRGLDPGSYELTLDAPSTSNYIGGYYTTLNANHVTPNAGSASAIVVGPNKVALQVKLSTGFKIGGTISGAGVGVLAGVAVTASGANGIGGAATDAAGKYLIQGLPAGTYTVIFDAPFNANFQSGYYSSVPASHFVVSPGSATGVTIGP